MIYSKNETQLNSANGTSPSRDRANPPGEQPVSLDKDFRGVHLPIEDKTRHATWYMLLLVLTAAVASWQAHADNLCTRGVYFAELADGTCAPMQFFTPPKWSTPSPGNWFIGNEGYITPQPAFDSQEDVVQFFVASNPRYDICGTTPYLVQDFEYGGLLDYGGGFQGGFVAPDPLYGIAYAFSVQWHIGANDVEYGGVVYKWVIPNLGVVPHVCNNIATIFPYRRRIAACPDSYGTNYSAVEADYYGRGVTTIPTSIFQLPDVCFKPLPFKPKNLGDCDNGSPMLGNPINVATGNKFQRETDIRPGPLASLGFERYYNSAAIGSQTLGRQWRHTYDRSVAVDLNLATGVAWMQRPDGKGYKFSKPATGVQWTSDPDVVDRLYEVVDINNNLLGWQYITKDDDTELYDASGKLQSITARSGATQTLTYSTGVLPNVPRAGLLMTVVDSLGRQLNFSYDSLARITAVNDPAQVYQYAYGANGNLATVTFPGGIPRGYLYNEQQFTQNTNLPGALTGIVDENGTRFATFSYDSTGRATITVHAGGVNQYQFGYSPFPPFSSVVTDPLGTQRTFGYSLINGAFKNTSLSQPCASCGGATASAISYDLSGNVASRGDFNGKKACYTYDLNRNLETSRLEGALSSETCSTVMANPPNRADVRKVTTVWNASYRLPATISEPAPGGTKTTTFTYDTSGNLTQKSITAPKNDGTSNTITRTWNWTYTTFGRALTATDPDHNTTSTTYYADNDPDLGKRGNVQTITNAAGHVTTITAYDLNGRPLSITDPNGLVTTLIYHPRGWLTSRQVGAEVTSYIYDGVGQLTKVTLPDGSYLQYTYDLAHRLTQINDGLGNNIVYTLDAIGNRTREDVYDPAAQLARTRSHTFDTLNRLASDIGALNQTTLYTYDNNGNLLTAKDPLNHQSGNIYDALNRLTQVLDPNLGTTGYAYDGANNLTQVSDPRGSATSYTYDGLNNLTKLVSPDTGTTNNTYDAAGNLLTKTDARGAVATYTYDVLNRVSQIIYSKSGTPSETHVFTYDSGANAKGRLSAVTDPAAVSSWTYNSQGRVASKAQQVGSIIRNVAYGYNAAGQLTTITTPSGQQIGYGYTNNRISSVTINGASLVTGANTKPFGPLSAWHWGSGLFTFRDYDTDGRLADWEFRNGTSILRKNQNFDAASRITAIADPNTPTASQAYQYDVLDRLTVAQTGNPVTHTQQFSYDAVGNRQNATVDGAVANLSYAQTGNQLQTMVGAVSANYFNGATALTFGYNNANRLVRAQSSGVTIAGYAVNALGQRISKIAAGVTTLFVYDEQGHLLGEYDNTGNLIQETVWLEDLPVATLRPTGTGNPTPIAIYYVHADHLGSPRAVTRPSDNAIMWHWDNVDPFGVNAANENPAGQGVFKYAMRFPGQYYDSETGTHYNYYRDYDPTTGRYVESDPIGLKGGLNSYLYASADPVSFTDPTGTQDLPKIPRFPSNPGPKPPSWFPNWYGNWCGPGGSVWIFDCIDAACKKHDKCYDDCDLSAGNRWLPPSLWKNCPFTCDKRFLAEVYKCMHGSCN